VGAGAVHFHHRPSLRLILADIFFRAIDFFTAAAIAIAILAMITVPIAALVAVISLVLRLFSICGIKG
jgi:hypothetical protein